MKDNDVIVVIFILGSVQSYGETIDSPSVLIPLTMFSMLPGFCSFDPGGPCGQKAVCFLADPCCRDLGLASMCVCFWKQAKDAAQAIVSSRRLFSRLRDAL